MADVKKIIKDLGASSFAGSNEEQMKMVQLLKGLATNDDKLANEFMKAIDAATTATAKKVLGTNESEEEEVDDKKKKKVEEKEEEVDDKKDDKKDLKESFLDIANKAL